MGRDNHARHGGVEVARVTRWRAPALVSAAAELASALSLPLTVLHVVREANATDARVLDEAQRYLQAYALDLRFEMLTGHPHDRITQTVIAARCAPSVVGSAAIRPP